MYDVKPKIPPILDTHFWNTLSKKCVSILGSNIKCVYFIHTFCVTTLRNHVLSYGAFQQEYVIRNIDML